MAHLSLRGRPLSSAWRGAIFNCQKMTQGMIPFCRFPSVHFTVPASPKNGLPAHRHKRQKELTCHRHQQILAAIKH